MKTPTESFEPTKALALSPLWPFKQTLVRDAWIVKPKQKVKRTKPVPPTTELAPF
jgi:hypothetical protein